MAGTETYVALLRAVNVGGVKAPMRELRELFERLGHRDVRTYIQSGNVVFSAADPGAGPERIASLIEERLTSEMGLVSTVILRSGDELARVAAASPLDTSEPSKLAVAFLKEEPERTRAAGLAPPPGRPDELVLAGRELYVRCPNGFGRSKLNNAYLERKLGVQATWRNWNTVLKLNEMTGGG